MRPLNRSVGGGRLALFLLAVCLPCEADERRLKFQHLGVEEGLSHTWVRDIAQDSRGFLWVGTTDGLNRYDGSTVVVYRHRPEDVHSLASSQAMVVFEDARKRLWVGAGALHLYDRDADRFDRYPLAPEAGTPANVEIRDIRDDADGRLWVGGIGGLFRFDPEKGTWARFRNDPRDPGSLSHDAVMSVLRDRRGRLWVGTRGGLNRYDEQAGEFVHSFQGPSDPPRFGALNVEKMYEDEDGTIWLGTIDEGLIRFEPESGRTKQYLPDPRNPNAIIGTRILSLTGDGKGTLYLGAEGLGLNVLDTRTERFTHYLLDPDDPTSLSSASVYDVRLDDQGILWLGTFNGGVDYASPFAQRFGLVRARAGGLRDPHVMALLEDHTGDLWIGTDGGGLDRWDRKTGRFTSYRHDPLKPASLASNAVLSLHEDPQHYLWVGMWAGGLDRLDPATGRFEHHRNDPGDPNAIADCVWTIVEDDDGHLLVGTQGLGVQVFDRKTGTFTALSKRYPGLGERSPIVAIVVDPDGNLWLSDPGGPQYVDRKAGKVTRYALPLGAPQSIRLDSRRNVWVGTDGGGLYCLESESRRLQRYTVADGLPSDNVADLLEDEAGNLWLGTTRGLAKLEDAVRLPGKARIVNFDAFDGLQGSEFKRGAASRSPRGEMFFGGQRGFNFFFPKDIRMNPHPPRVVLTDLRVFNQPVRVGAPESPLRTTITEAQELVLSHRDSVVTFEFAALDFVQPWKNQYRYRLDGLDPDWNRVGHRRLATYTNLQPGAYTLRVAGSNSDGVWNEQGVALRVRVIPPFWRTWTFQTILAFAVLGAALGAHRLRVRQHVRAEREMKARIHEALAQIKTLSGLLPICAWCKKVRDDSGYWNQIETYVKDHTEAQFSHGICPECRQKIETGAEP